LVFITFLPHIGHTPITVEEVITPLETDVASSDTHFLVVSSISFTNEGKLSFPSAMLLSLFSQRAVSSADFISLIGRA
jgi:hypothetical protein